MLMSVERHPLQPFLPPGTRVLLLGSFPPPQARWSMPFFYPNYINDMWRVMGHIFFADRQHFVDEAHHTFRLELLVPFLEERGIALYDTACAVRRLRDNASDKFLEVAEPTDIAALVRRLPALQALVATGQKATDTLVASLQPHAAAVAPPPVGGYVPLVLDGRALRFYRMPSTSRAYPLAFEKKADFYARLFRDAGLL